MWEMTNEDDEGEKFFYQIWISVGMKIHLICPWILKSSRGKNEMSLMHDVFVWMWNIP